MIEHLRGREKALEPLGWIGDRRPASANRSGCRVRRAVPGDGATHREGL